MRHLLPLLGLSLFACASAPVQRPEFDPRKVLRVATWNVHLGRALGSAPGEPGVAELMNEHPGLGGVELLALQELCGNGGGWQLAYFENAMRQAHGTAHTAFVRVDPADPMMCERGQALVSAHPIVASGRVELPHVRQTRALLWADLLVPDADGESTPLRVYVPHFENRGSTGTGSRGRAAQAQAVLEHLDAWRKTHPTTPVLLMGDLNSIGHLFDPRTRELALELFASRFEPSLPDYQPTMPTWPWQVDWIFADGLDLVFSEVARIDGSDHWPVCADYVRPTAP